MKRPLTASEQARADALADAETLRLAKADALGVSIRGRRFARSLVGKAGKLGTLSAAFTGPAWAASVWHAGYYANGAASAAFRAAPGLRGE